MNSIFPLRESPVEPPFPCASSRLAPTRTKRILVLDDDALTRQLTAMILARAGYLVDTAEDGEHGWDALCGGHYKLLVTDNDMPRLTGLRLIERLRVAGFTLPVIVASGSLELGEVNDYPLLDLAAILHKPFGFAELISLARRAVPIAPDAGAGVVHCLELHCDGSIPFPFPARRDARPGVFAQTA